MWTLNPRCVVWPLELGIWTLNPRCVVWPLELGVWTLNPRSVAWPLELGIRKGGKGCQVVAKGGQKCWAKNYKWLHVMPHTTSSIKLQLQIQWYHCTDSMPTCTVGGTLSDVLSNPKYASHVYEVTVAVDNLGNIVWICDARYHGICNDLGCMMFPPSCSSGWSLIHVPAVRPQCPHIARFVHVQFLWCLLSFGPFLGGCSGSARCKRREQHACGTSIPPSLLPGPIVRYPRLTEALLTPTHTHAGAARLLLAVRSVTQAHDEQRRDIRHAAGP